MKFTRTFNCVDIRSLSNNPFLLNMIDAIEREDTEQINHHKSEVEVLFKTISEGSGIYDQIRYIDETGIEVVRVNLSYRDYADIVSPEELQNKSHRYYFKEAIRLNEGEIYISKLDLNKEHGEVKSPHKPMLRYAIPIFDSEKQKRGILVLNVLADYLLKNVLTHRFIEGTDSYLLDKEGFYLLHPKISKRWGSLSNLNTGENIKNDIPHEVTSFILSGNSGDKFANKKYFNFMPIKFDPLDAERYWIFMESLDKSIVYSPIYTFYKVFGVLVLLLTVGVVTTAFIFSKRLTRPLNELVKGVTAVAEGDLDYHINIRSNDEIAFLAFSFNKMVHRIGKTRKQLEDYVDNLEKKVIDKTEEIFGKARQQKIVAEIGKLLWADLDIQDIMDRIVKLVYRTLKVEFCEILLLDKSGEFLRLVSGVGWKEGIIGNATVGIGLETQAGCTLKELRPIVIRDLRTDDRFPVLSLQREYGVISGASVPMIVGGHTIGIMGVHSTQPRVFSRADISFLESVAHLVAAAIERRRAEEEIRKGKENIENLIKTAQDAIVCIDEKGIINVWNQSAEKIFGYSKSEIIGQPVTTIIPERYKKKHQEGLNRLLRTRKPETIGKTIEASGKTKKGTEIPIELSLSFHEIEENRYSFTGIIRDITIQKEAKEKLREKTAEIEKINKELEDFVYIVSHDLKEPLFAIDGYTSRLFSGYKDTIGENGERYINRIKVNAKKMSQKIQEILDVLRIGRVSYNFKNNDVGDIVKNVVSLSESRIKTSNIHVVIQDELPTVLCDRERLMDVFSNLITNAIKFIGSDKKRGIRIGCNKNGNYYKFFVEDSGIGIQKEYQEQIFKIFRRLQDIEAEGTGVGLAIVKKIIETHNGKVWVESPVNEGKGSRFCFTIPMNGGHYGRDKDSTC